ncbi:MAG: DUF3108 domain-containing protein [Hydrogenimonas sp.]|nr:DUF3108 domain-containing protein [Hydrogenimonas sp.]
MKRFIVLITFLAVSLLAESMHATYKIEYGIFGKMGVSDAYLTKKDGHYEIKMVAKATGLAKVLSGGRVEIYGSKGRVVDGVLVPESFSKDIRRSNKRRIKVYTFDHEAKKVTFHEENYKDGKLKDKKDETLAYYAKNDILSLYFNVEKIIGSCGEPFAKDLKAVGAQKRTGRVRVETITGGEREKLKRSLGSEPCYLKVTIFQKLFGSKGGELYLSLNDRFVVQKALLKDVIMFGDIRGKIVHFEEKK